jgi:hypothetical protein
VIVGCSVFRWETFTSPGLLGGAQVSFGLIPHEEKTLS